MEESSQPVHHPPHIHHHPHKIQDQHQLNEKEEILQPNRNPMLDDKDHGSPSLLYQRNSDLPTIEVINHKLYHAGSIFLGLTLIASTAIVALYIFYS